MYEDFKGILEHLEQHPELFETKNEEDMWDYRDPDEDVDQDDWYDEEDDDEYGDWEDDD